MQSNQLVRAVGRRTLASLLMTSTALGLFGSALAPASAATTNVAIKGSSQAVYWYASNGRRYVFPNAATFNSWAGLMGDVQQITDAELYTIPLGGNVTYRPGIRLIKITTDPRVYAVARNGVLRWIMSEAIARDLYGAAWATTVDDIPDEFFVNYVVGQPIARSSDFSPTVESRSVAHPGDNIGASASTQGSAASTPVPPAATQPQGSTNQTQATQGVPSFTSVTFVDTDGSLKIKFSADIGTATNIARTSKVDIYEESTGQYVWTMPSLPNFYTRTLGTPVTLTKGYYAVFYDMSGAKLAPVYTKASYVAKEEPRQQEQGKPSFTNSAFVDVDGNLKVKFSADVGTTTNVSRTSSVEIYEASTGQRIWTMPSLPNFYTYTLGKPVTLNKSYYAIFRDIAGAELPRAYTTVEYTAASDATQSMPPAAAAAASLNITLKSELDPNQPNKCNQAFGAQVTISTDTEATLTYQWERSDGAISQKQTATFKAGMPQVVRQSWFLPSEYSGWMQLHVLGPVDQYSSPVVMTSTCK